MGIGAASPLAIAFFAWIVLRERTPLSSILTALLGIVGVLMIVGASTGGLNPVGVASSVATALAYFCWFSGFQHLPATTVGIIGLINPVTGVILGVALGGDHVTVIQVAGILTVITSVLISQYVTYRTGRAARSATRIAVAHTS